MTARTVLIGARLFFGVLTLAAVGAQLIVHIQHGLDVVNFFSYFTNLSSLFLATVLLIGASTLIANREPTTQDDVIRGAAVVSMAIVGMVFAVLLRDVESGPVLPWANAVRHYIMPVVAVVDWVCWPPRMKLQVKHIPLWLIFPLLYLAYLLIRIASVGWYAYPFLNPDRAGGYGAVFLYCLGIIAAFIVVSWLLLTLGNGVSPAWRSAPTGAPQNR